MASPAPTPGDILIVGSGVFGLSTALALTQREAFSSTKITVVDRSPFPSPDGSSIDTSRIIRADYADPAYAALASLAQAEWRKQGPSDLGGQGRYSESGLVLVANQGSSGEPYVRSSFTNVLSISAANADHTAVTELPNGEAIKNQVGTGGGSGDWGYVNHRSGWADAEAGMKYLRSKAEATSRINFLTAEVTSLLYSSPTHVSGVNLRNGTSITADLVILATGAWTSSLIDLRGRAQATGQILTYFTLTPEEQKRYENIPVLLNMSTGMFVIPPRNNILKIARHGYGYTNPVPPPASISNPENDDTKISLPRTTYDDPSLSVPTEGLRACRNALTQMLPDLSPRPFTHSKICWYTDTPSGDFIITHHPSLSGLFLATGGSGHGYKFLPVIGSKIVDCVQGVQEDVWRRKWGWRQECVDEVVTEDGSRGGGMGMVLEEELRKGSRL